MSLTGKIQLYSRILSAKRRAVPDFLLVGVQKSGTTSLFHYLTQHPQVIPPVKKEIQYFDKNYRKGFSWYKAHFPVKDAICNKCITGEASTDYSFHPLAPERIKSDLGRPKLILLLRDPAKRAISHFYHYLNKGRETLSINDVFDIEEERLSHFYQGSLESNFMKDSESKRYIRFSYKKKGLYLEQIKRIHKLFGKEALFIGSVEEMTQHPVDFYRRICTFLNIDNSVLPEDLSAKNLGDYQVENPEILESLREYYREHNQELFDYIGQEFPWGD